MSGTGLISRRYLVIYMPLMADSREGEHPLVSSSLACLFFFLLLRQLLSLLPWREYLPQPAYVSLTAYASLGRPEPLAWGMCRGSGFLLVNVYLYSGVCCWSRQMFTLVGNLRMCRLVGDGRLQVLHARDPSLSGS